MHGPTYMGNPLACAVALANLDLLGTVTGAGRSRGSGSALAAGLAGCRISTGVVDVRTLGAVGVVQLDRPVDVAAATDAALDVGVWLRPFRDLVYTMPPYVCTAADVARIGAAVGGGERGMSGELEAPDWRHWLAERAAARERRAARALVPRGPDDDVLDLAGNDYLGLARDPRVIAAAAAAARAMGGGRRRVTAGHREPWTCTSSSRRRWRPSPAGRPRWSCSTGYHANLAAVAALADRDALVVSDAHNHASLVDACRLSRAEVVVTPHGDVAAVDGALRGRPTGRARWC